MITKENSKEILDFLKAITDLNQLGFVLLLFGKEDDSAADGPIQVARLSNLPQPITALAHYVRANLEAGAMVTAPVPPSADPGLTSNILSLESELDRQRSETLSNEPHGPVGG